MIKRVFFKLAAFGLFASTSAAHAAAPIDNSALDQPGFREHKATYGVVYRLPRTSMRYWTPRSGPRSRPICSSWA